MSLLSSSFLFQRRPVPVVLACLVAGLSLLACGGGVEGQGTGSSPAFAMGPINGFGSIVVNGVHFDDTSAAVQDDDGHVLTRDDLKLGMVVAIDSSLVDPVTLTALAQSITVRSELMGPVTANDPAGASLVVLGQTVSVGGATVFDERLSGGQSAIAVGSVVRVYAVLDPASGRYQARRIEPQSTPSGYHIRGVARAVDLSARTFVIGGQSFKYAEGAAPTGLANGSLVRVRVQTRRNEAGQWVVQSVDNDRVVLADGTEVEIESVISRFASLADFTVDGMTVDASAARLEPATAVLATGARVEIEGTVRNGVLVARKVALKDASDDDDDDDDDDDATIEIEGRISAIDSTAQTFLLRGNTVSYAGDVEFENGDASDLGVDVKVSVKGRLSSDGTQVMATQIEIDD